MDTATNEVLHVVVGAGNVLYFLNAIRSLQRLGAGDIYGAYNFVGDVDRRAIIAQSGHLRDLVRLDIRENISGMRTGSLYDANNDALAFAHSKYDFVSFLQADMQVVWWDSAILLRARALTATVSQGSGVSFYTQLPIMGKHPRPYEKWMRDENLQAYRSSGHVDVCLLPIFSGYNSGFVFQGTERELSMQRSFESATLFFHPFPYVAPIPFPSTLRDLDWAKTKKRNRTTIPILRINDNFSVNFQREEFHPFSMEQSVVPNQWSTLIPYWPSDTLTKLWVSRRLEYCRRYNHSFLSVINSEGHVRPVPLSSFAPGWMVLIIGLISAALERLTYVLRRPKSWMKESI